MSMEELNKLYSSNWDDLDYSLKSTYFEHYCEHNNFEVLLKFVLENDKFKKFLTPFVKNYDLKTLSTELFWEALDNFKKSDNEVNIFYTCAESILVALSYEWTKALKENNCEFEKYWANAKVNYEFNIINFDIEVKSLGSASRKENIEKAQELALENKVIGPLELDPENLLKITSFTY